MELKSFREDKLKMTQAQFAELIGEEQSNISRWEKSGEPPLTVIQKISQKTGVDFNTLLGWTPPSHEALNVKNNWTNTEFTKRSLTDYIEDALNKMDIPEEQRNSYIDDLQAGVLDSLIKPKIAIVGRSDTGKSTMINSLLGMDKMPTSWTPKQICLALEKLCRVGISLVKLNNSERTISILV
ncbi:MAG: helix-turn-helix domain-containing protein [Clostridia bacterium]|nr:helix-turn-helix domain-containing protein [Clostridia bacterium]